MAVKIDDDDDEGGGSGIQTSNHNSSFYLLHDFGAFLGYRPKKYWNRVINKIMNSDLIEVWKL